MLNHVTTDGIFHKRFVLFVSITYLCIISRGNILQGL